jgi:predicted O-methyltransferase YrrM
MRQNTWNAVDDYFNAALQPADEVLAAALSASEAADLPAYAVAPNQGKWLHMMARLMGARRILEIGTLGGYSTIWLARALPNDGELFTLECELKHAEVARANIARAGLTSKVEVRIGAALDLLPKVSGPFDLIFIDADKPNNPQYFSWALKLARRGSLIVVDNVVRGGAVVDAPDDPKVAGVRTMVNLIANEKRVSATALQTVGHKGYDGLLFAHVVADA